MIKRIKSISKRTLALLLTMLMLISSGIVGAVAANVELAETGATGTVYFDASTYGWTNVNCYLWNGSNTSQNNGWPGKAMTKVAGTDSIWSYNNSNNSYTKVIFNNGSGQTGDLDFQSGKIYSRAWNTYTAPDTTDDLTAVLRGTKIMFYIGEPSSWNQSKFFIRDGKNSYQLDYGSSLFTLSSNKYTAVSVAPNKTTYYIYHFGWSDGNYGSLISSAPVAGGAYITGSGTANASKKLDGYSVTATLNNTTINAGSDVGVTATLPTPHSGSTKEMSYYYTTDSTVNSSSNFTKLDTSGSNLVTSGLGAGTYYIYPVFYDGYLYVRGSKMTLTVQESNYTYSVTAGEGGTVSPEGTFTVAPNTSVDLVATPNSADGYEFDKWEFTNGTGDTTTATTTFTPTANNASAKAIFKLKEHTISFLVNPAGAGNVTLNPETGVVQHGNPVTLTASANRGYNFLGWSKNGTDIIDTNVSITVNAVESLSYTAMFEKRTDDVTVAVNNNIAPYTGSFKVYLEGTSATAISSEDYTGTFYPGEKVTVELNSPTHYYVSDLSINNRETNYAENETYFSGTADDGYPNYWTFKYTFEITENLTLDFTHSPNPTVSVEAPDASIGTLTVSPTGKFSYKRPVEITANVTNEDYFIQRIYAVDPETNVEIEEYKNIFTGNASSDTTIVKTIYNTCDMKIKVDFAQKSFNYVAIEADGKNIEDINFSFLVNNREAVANADKKFKVGVNATAELQVTELANSPYYIESISYEGIELVNNNGDKNKLYLTTGEFTINENEESKIVIKYGVRDTYTVTVVNDGNGTMGTLSAGTTTGLFKDDVFEITPTPKEGFTFEKWIITGVEGVDYTRVETNNNTLKIKVLGDVTIEAKWVVKSTSTITLKAPASLGWAQGTFNGNVVIDTMEGTDVTNTFEADSGNIFTFTAGAWDSSYKYEWKINGAEYEVDPETNVATVTAGNTDVTVEVVFDSGEKWIYIENGGNWSNVKVCVNSTSNEVEVEEYATGVYRFKAPLTTSWFKVYQTTENQEPTYQVNLNSTTILEGNTTNTKYNSSNSNSDLWYYEADYDSGSDEAPATYKITGDISVDLENYGDGLHIGSLQIPANKNSVSFNILGSDGKYWNLNDEQGENSAPVVESTSSGTKITLNFESNENGIAIDFSFDKANGVLSWTYSQMKATVTVTMDFGINQSVIDMAENEDIGCVRFDTNEDNVYTANNVDGGKATVAAGEEVFIYTDISGYAQKDGKTDYYVYGWVINGTEFTPASSTDGLTFRGSYAFTKDSTIVPVYFHTPKWCDDNGVTMATIFAYTPTDEDSEWKNGITSYTWFYKPGTQTNVYTQFGAWSGQYMIPTATGKYMTFVETNTTVSGTAYDVSGITFCNIYKAGSSYKQTYDYYEFVSLLEDNKQNISFVIKEGNDRNKDKNLTTSTTITPTASTWNWVEYRDVDGDKIDIYRDKITDDTTNTEKLYIVREGYYNYMGTTGNKKDRQGNAVGEFYLQVWVYDSNGNRVDGPFLSYELAQEGSEFFTEHLAEYVTTNNKDYHGATVYVDYEDICQDSKRYDGEWYGFDETDLKTEVSVQVALREDNGNIVYANSNIAEYGAGTISIDGGDGQASVEVNRGGSADLFATKLGKFKIVGWYEAVLDENGNVAGLGKEVSKHSSATITATNRSVYIALYERLGEGMFQVSNEFYVGLGNASGVPMSHGGDSIRSVSVKQTDTSGAVIEHAKQRDSVEFEATEGDVLEITIYTDAKYPEDYFYAWYIGIRSEDGSKVVNFEEVGVDEVHLNKYDEVKFTFTYTVTEDVSSITIYSDCYHKVIKKNILYNYTNRYGEPKTYVFPDYTLSTDAELTNGYPSQEAVISNAPWVDDIYKNVSWEYTKESFDEENWVVTAVEEAKTFNVSVAMGPDIYDIGEFNFNENVSIFATTYDENATNDGVWFVDKDGLHGYTAGDYVLAYGTYYGLLVTEDVTLSYEYGLDLEYLVDLSEPVYGREQEGINGATDTIYVDYTASIHVPFFTGDELPNGNKITQNIYNGETLVSANSPVTLETLEANGYEVTHGYILEQVGNFKVGEDQTYKTFTDAYNKAKLEGFESATDKEDLDTIIRGLLSQENSKSNFGEILGVSKKGGSSDEYYTVYDSSDKFVSNKNRFRIVIESENTVSKRGAFYNVYAYVGIKDKDTGVIEYYFSNLQTLNFYVVGTNVVTNSTNS
ncbi:MAG: starch-binding protein [Ruminococcus sp.]|nr:starch-binding protein [Ruminococcus sp.]